MIKLNQAVIVEGKYDKIRLQSVIDALIITTDGFGIFKDKQKRRFIERLAKTRGIIIMTDSDSAGFKIRSFLGGCANGGSVTHVYIPEILGKERRKAHRSAEGLLGVEGVNKDIIERALAAAGVWESANAHHCVITRLDLYNDGLYGRPDSSAMRAEFLRRLDLPRAISASMLPDAVACLITREQYECLVEQIRNSFARQNL